LRKEKTLSINFQTLAKLYVKRKRRVKLPVKLRRTRRVRRKAHSLATEMRRQGILQYSAFHQLDKRFDNLPLTADAINDNDVNELVIRDCRRTNHDTTTKLRTVAHCRNQRIVLFLTAFTLNQNRQAFEGEKALHKAFKILNFPFKFSPLATL
jgi:hypothetical protein